MSEKTDFSSALPLITKQPFSMETEGSFRYEDRCLRFLKIRKSGSDACGLTDNLTDHWECNPDGNPYHPLNITGDQLAPFMQDGHIVKVLQSYNDENGRKYRFYIGILIHTLFETEKYWCIIGGMSSGLAHNSFDENELWLADPLNYTRFSKFPFTKKL